jgi:hypothetical protein
MSLMSVVRSACKVADRVTKSLQPIVQHEAVLSVDGSGAIAFAAAVPRAALIDYSQKIVANQNGQMVVSQARITLLTPVAVTVQDQFTLPDGTTGPIISLSGVMDAETGTLIVEEIAL